MIATISGSSAPYGDLDGADKILEWIGDPQKKAQDQIQLADLLWKLGDPGEAPSVAFRGPGTAVEDSKPGTEGSIDGSC